jgi:hypothetical protein
MNSTIIECPVDGCSYELDATPPQIENEAHAQQVAEVLGAPSTFFPQMRLLKHGEQVEQMLRDHMDAHEPVSYLLTIARLNAELTEAKAAYSEMLAKWNQEMKR